MQRARSALAVANPGGEAVLEDLGEDGICTISGGDSRREDAQAAYDAVHGGDGLVLDGRKLRVDWARSKVRENIIKFYAP